MIGIIFYWSINIVLCGMSSLAYLMTACFLFFSAFSGMVPAATVSKSKGNCCQHIAGKASCPHDMGQGQKGGCEKSGCNMLSSCGVCSFLAVKPVTLKSVLSEMITEQMSLYNLRAVSNYTADSWKPPKVS